MDLYSHYNGKLGLICLIIYLIMLIRGRKTFSGTMGQSNNYWFVFVFMALYSVLGFLEWDTYHYYAHYEEMRQAGYRIHVEQFYFWLTQVLPHSYTLYRFSIWGIASLLMVLSAKMIKLNSEVYVAWVPLLFLSEIAVTRGALGISLMIFAAILFVKSLQEKKIALVVLAIALLVASSYLHKSMIIFIFILIVSLLFPLNKRTLIISLILFPFLYGIVYGQFINFSYFSILNDDQEHLISAYQSSEQTAMNFNGIIMELFQKTMLLLLLFIIIKRYLYDNIQVSKPQYMLFKYSYLMIYISFLFLGQNVSNWISDRTLHAGTFALVLCATHCYDVFATHKQRNTIEKVVIVGFFIISFWDQFSFIRLYW